MPPVTLLTAHCSPCRHAYVTALKELGWRKVAALTQDGAKYSDYMSTLQVQYAVHNSTVQYSTIHYNTVQYSDYMSTLQDEFKNNHMEFIMNRKFPKEAIDMKMVTNNRTPTTSCSESLNHDCSH